MITCKEVLLNYIQSNDGFHKKVHLYAVAEDWSPETVGRDLRDLETEEKIKVDYYIGKRTKRKLAMYANKEYIKPKTHYKVIDGVAVLING